MHRSIVTVAVATAVVALPLGITVAWAAGPPANVAQAAPPAPPICQSGISTVAVTDATVGLSGPVAINAATPPVVMTNISTPSGAAIRWTSNAVSITRSAFVIRVTAHGAPSTVTLNVQWLACATTPIGPTPTSPTQPTAQPTRTPTQPATTQPPDEPEEPTLSPSDDPPPIAP